MKRILITFFVLVCILGVAGAPQANLIINGDFETGVLNPWVDASGSVVVADADNDGASAWGMTNNYAKFGSIKDNGILYQFVNVAGVSKLEISFDWYFAYSDLSLLDLDLFLALFSRSNNTITLLSLFTKGTFQDPYYTVEYGSFHEIVDISVLGDGIIGLASFWLLEPIQEADLVKSYAGIDNVLVAAVPEPATLLLIGSGLLGLAGCRRRLGRTHST